MTSGVSTIDLNAALMAAADASVGRKLAELQRPELVSQRTVLAVVGMGRRDYMDHCRAGDWPSYCDRRLRYSRTADVLAWLQAHPAKPDTAAKVASNDNDAEAAIFAKYGARRVAE
jgi:hypothetical protein